jgi:hypothetical protein
MAFKKDAIKFILPFPDALCSCDQWVGNMAQLIGSCTYIAEPLHLYRRHGFNVSGTTGKSVNPLWFKIYFRICMAIVVLIRFAKVKMIHHVNISNQ